MIRPEYAVTADGRQLDATTITDSYIKAVNINRSIIANAQVAQISLYTVCKGLKEMRDGKLYKELGYQNFKDYCENEVFVPGNHLQCFDTPWGKCGILLCYDIRFPEVSRILAQNGAQILFCPAAFNEQATKKHWKLFTQTRALENEVFLCGVAPAKYTYKNYTSGGHSILVDGFGNIVVELGEEEAYKVVDIDLNDIEKVRKRMPYWKVRRNDLYELKEIKK